MGSNPTGSTTFKKEIKMTKGEIISRLKYVTDECEILVYDDNSKTIIPILDILYEMKEDGEGRMVIFLNTN